MLIELKNVFKTYKKEKNYNIETLNNINLTLPNKGLIFVVGEPNSGKKALLNLIGGFDKPTYGNVYVDNQKLETLSENKLIKYRNTYVGFVFNENEFLNDSTILKNVELPLLIDNKNNLKESALAILDKVGLSSYIDKKPDELSSIQKEHLALARALIKNPKILICDEISSTSIKKCDEATLSLLKEISVDRLVIITTNNKDAATKFGDRVIEMKNGTIISDKDSSNEVDLNNNDFQIGSKHLPFKELFDMSLKLFRNNLFSLIITAIITFICFTSIGSFSTYLFNDLNDNIYQSLVDSNTHTIFYSPAAKTPEMYDEYNISFDMLPYNNVTTPANSKDYDFLVSKSKKYDIRVDKLFSKNIDSFDDYYAINGYLEIDNTFVEDYNFDLFKGTLPIKDNEIAISKYLADGFIKNKKELNGTVVEKYEDLIFNGSNEIEIDTTKFAITGIIDTKFDEKFYSPLFNSENLDFEVKMLYQTKLKKEMQYGLHNTIFLVNGAYNKFIAPKQFISFPYDIVLDFFDDSINMNHFYLNGSYEYYFDQLKQEDAIYYDEREVSNRTGTILFIPSDTVEYTKIKNIIDTFPEGRVVNAKFNTMSDIIQELYGDRTPISLYQELLDYAKFTSSTPIAAIFPSQLVGMEDCFSVLDEKLINELNDFISNKNYKRSIYDVKLVSPFIKNKVQVDFKDIIYGSSPYMIKKLVIQHDAVKTCSNAFHNNTSHGTQYVDPLFYISITSLVLSVIAISVNYCVILRKNKKEIMLFNCLGMKRSDVSQIYIINCVLLNLGIFVLSLILPIFFPYWLNATCINNLVNFNYTVYQYSALSILMAFASMLFITVIGLIVPLCNLKTIKGKK